MYLSVRLYCVCLTDTGWPCLQVLFEMCVGSVPYEDDQHPAQKPAQVMVRVLSGELPLVPATVEPLCAAWMQKCWLESANRITASHLHAELKAALTKECPGAISRWQAVHLRSYLTQPSRSV